MFFKYKVALLIILLISIFSLSVVDASSKNDKLDLFGKVIIVDPGHGGRDPGTRYGNILEKDLNLEISKKLVNELENEGAIVYMTRNTDIDLSKSGEINKKRNDLYRRVRFIENKKSDLYLSIHLNWFNNRSFSGAEILYNNINKNNKFLAQTITDSFDNNGIKTRDIRTTNLYIYRNTTVPGLLIECGFLSNNNDRYLLQQSWYQRKIGKIITNGSIKYFNNIK